MVGDVMRTSRTMVVGWLSIILIGQAWALGPQAPFVAPDVVSLSAGDVKGDESTSERTTQGLSGVRVGRYAGAVIDGRWVRKGRSIRGARLIEVRRNGVTLRHPDGRREVLSMFTAQSQSPGTTVAMQKEVVKP